MSKALSNVKRSARTYHGTNYARTRTVKRQGMTTRWNRMKLQMVVPAVFNKYL